MTATKIKIALAAVSVILVAALTIGSIELKLALERLAAEGDRTKAAERSGARTDRMSLSLQSWGRSEPGSIGLMSMVIINTNGYGVKDITISCRFDDEHKVQLSQRQHTIHDVIPANSRKDFADLNVGTIDGKAELAECSVSGALRD